MSASHFYKGSGKISAVKDNHVKNLRNLSYVELLELKKRQNNILKHIPLNRLPDGGKRIHEFNEKISKEFDRRTNADEVTKLLSGLSIVKSEKETLSQIEWSHKNGNSTGLTELEFDSDDEPENELQVMAQNKLQKRNVKISPKKSELITAKDIDEMECLKTANSDIIDDNASTKLKDTKTAISSEMVFVDVDNLKSKLNIPAKPPTEIETLNAHEQYIVNKTEGKQQVPEKFKPFKTTISNTHDSQNERNRRFNQHWEITAATPPPLQHKAAELIPLADSIKLQLNHFSALKKAQEENACERLAAKLKCNGFLKIEPSNIEKLKRKVAFTTYRTTIDTIKGDQKQSFDDN